MAKFEKVSNALLNMMIEIEEKAGRRNNVSALLELKQRRTADYPDEGKPSVIADGGNYSLSYANPEDLENLN
jgi:hypothetical protein